MELKRLQNINPYIVMLNKVINKTAPDPHIDFIGENYKLTPEFDERHYTKRQIITYLLGKITAHQIEVAELITKITEAQLVAIQEDVVQNFATGEVKND